MNELTFFASVIYYNCERRRNIAPIIANSSRLVMEPRCPSKDLARGLRIRIRPFAGQRVHNWLATDIPVLAMLTKSTRPQLRLVLPIEMKIPAARAGSALTFMNGI